MSNEARDFLLGGAPTASFIEVGTVHKGRIRSYEKTQQRDMATGNPKTWDNGEPMWQIVFTLETDERDATKSDDDGVRRVFAKGGMLTAIRDAIRKTGHTGDFVGGTLAVKYSGNGTPKQAGFNPPKEYQAIFTPPSGVDEFDAVADTVSTTVAPVSSSWAEEDPF